MKRILILIANVGTVDNPAAGAKKDIDDYMDFFMSDNGGAWDKNYEIISFDNASTSNIPLTWSILKTCIQCHNDSEYFMIVFCGHGEGIPGGDTKLELSTGNTCKLSDLFTILQNKRYTIIIDSCRSIEPLLENDSTLNTRFFSASQNESSYRELCRKYYETTIEQASNNNGIVFYSASFLESAIDNGAKRGGLFSQTLLDELRTKSQWLEKEVEKSNDSFGILHLSDCFNAVSSIVSSKSSDKQHPVLNTRNNVDDFPILVCPKKSI